MCYLCIETLKSKITPKEIARAYREYTMTQMHLDKFAEILREMGILDEVIDEYLSLEK